MGVYEEIKENGFRAEQSYFKNADNVTTGTFYLGHEEIYGYKGLRIFRRDLMGTLLKRVKERNIPIVVKRFVDLVAENENGVLLEFEDGSLEKADLVVGADGIHSTVRKLISTNSDSEPKYTGYVGLNTVIDMKKMPFPEDYKVPCVTIAKPGGFVMGPQDQAEEGMFIATQFAVEDPGREGWKEMKSRHGDLKALFQQNMEAWPDVIQSALENINEGDVTLWPFYLVPKLQDWATQTGRVAIVGDAAHAIPPTIGQGMNQGLEDGYILALALSKISPRISLSDAVAFWQRYRQAKIDKVVELSKHITNRMLPKRSEEEIEKGGVWQDEDSGNAEKEVLRLSWLYTPRIDEEVSEWVRMKATSPDTSLLSVPESNAVLVR